jgi:hypothetical protein
MTGAVVTPAVRPWAAPVGVAAAVAAATIWVAVVDPDRPGHYPLCPFHAGTRLWCPGCGSLRAVHALTHGDLAAAVHRNGLLVAALPVVAYAWVGWLRSPAGGRSGARLRVRTGHGYALVGLILAFGVLRNLPGFSFLAP